MPLLKRLPNRHFSATYSTTKPNEQKRLEKQKFWIFIYSETATSLNFNSIFGAKLIEKFSIYGLAEEK